MICIQLHIRSIEKATSRNDKTMLQKLCSAPNTLGFSSTFCFDFKYSSFEMRTPAKFSMIQKFFVSQRHQITLNRNIKQKLTKIPTFYFITIYRFSTTSTDGRVHLVKSAQNIAINAMEQCEVHQNFHRKTGSDKH